MALAHYLPQVTFFWNDGYTGTSQSWLYTEEDNGDCFDMTGYAINNDASSFRFAARGGSATLKIKVFENSNCTGDSMAWSGISTNSIYSTSDFKHGSWPTVTNLNDRISSFRISW